ncbi:hypothetical protein ACP70R_033241 [Stipagrostis hirtigluma subsp. patula]
MGRPTRAKGGAPLAIRVLSRRLVKASDASIKPRVDALNHLDILSNSVQGLQL